jgi:hypothetical protein
MEVYTSQDFIRYLKSLTANYSDLANDTAAVILSMPIEKRTHIEEKGYMLRYAQRTALRLWGASFRCKLDTNEYKSKIIADSLPGIDKAKVILTIKRHLKTPQYSIQAKMLLYAVEYGGARKLAAKIGVPPRTIQRIINEYIKCLKSELSHQ